MQGSEFIPTIAPMVVAENTKRGNPLFSSVVIAQAIVETGWGESSIMMKANAIFGIKATSDWPGKVYDTETSECYNGVNYVNIEDTFRAYDNLQESISDYFDLICGLSRYKNALYCSSPRECIQAIKDGGYATSPTYVDLVMSLIESNNLTRFDNETSENLRFIVGEDYETQVDLHVRDGAGKDNRIKEYDELTEDGRKHAYNQKNAVLKTGTIVTCQAVKKLRQ